MAAAKLNGLDTVLVPISYFIELKVDKCCTIQPLGVMVNASFIIDVNVVKC